MKNLYGVLVFFLVVFFLVGNCSGMSMTFENWGFNPQVSGTTYISPIDEMLVFGTTLNNSDQTSEGIGTFNALTTFQGTAFQNDGIGIGGTGLFNDYEITGIMNVYGSYARNDQNINILTFNGGSLEMYLDDSLNYGTNDVGSPGYIFGADDGNKIASFDLFKGTGSMDFTKDVPNGSTDLQWEAIELASGYWFTDNNEEMVIDQYNKVMARTNSDNTANLNPSVSQYNEFTTGTGYTWTADDNDATTFIQNDGSYEINSSPIPEPATFALFGLGLLGIARVGRKRS